MTVTGSRESICRAFAAIGKQIEQVCVCGGECGVFAVMQVCVCVCVCVCGGVGVGVGMGVAFCCDTKGEAICFLYWH